MTDKLKVERDPARMANIVKVRTNLGDLPVDAAKDCPSCGYPPVGMIKTPSFVKDGVEMPPVYEVGCIQCPPFYVEREDGEEKILDGRPTKVKRRSYSARATSLDVAIKKWNDEDFVEDNKFGLNVTERENLRLG